MMDDEVVCDGLGYGVVKRKLDYDILVQYPDGTEKILRPGEYTRTRLYPEQIGLRR
jgi:hypothetical protein